MVQALWLALVNVGIDLQTSVEGKAGRITFVGEADLFFHSQDCLTQPEWHAITIEGEALHWRKYPSWQRRDDGSWQRHWALEVARRPNTLGVGTSYPVDTVVGLEQVRDLVRVARNTVNPSCD